MQHKHSNWPFLVIFFLVAFAYFTFEVVLPFGVKEQEKDARCEKAGGQVVELSANKKICIQRSAIIEVGL